MESMRQLVSLLALNQLMAAIRGNDWDGTSVRNALRIHAALSPPSSVDAVSAIITGLFEMPMISS